FVMQAWGESLGVPKGLKLLSDGNADRTRAMGLAMDASGYGMGIRCKRLAPYAEDGGVKHLFAEAPGELEVASAEHDPEALGGWARAGAGAEGRAPASSPPPAAPPPVSGTSTRNPMLVHAPVSASAVSRCVPAASNTWTKGLAPRVVAILR